MSDEHVRQVETFRDVGDFELGQLKQDSPSAVSSVRVEKYLVTVERLAEPKTVYQARLQYLWDHCKNHHMAPKIKKKAEELGVEIDDSHGRMGSLANPEKG